MPQLGRLSLLGQANQFLMISNRNSYAQFLSCSAVSQTGSYTRGFDAGRVAISPAWPVATNLLPVVAPIPNLPPPALCPVYTPSLLQLILSSFHSHYSLHFPLSALFSPLLLPASSSSPLLCVPRHTSPPSVDCRGAKCSVTKFYASNRGPQSTCWPCLYCLPPFVGFCAAYFCDFNVLIDRRRCPPSMVPPPSLLLPLWR